MINIHLIFIPAEAEIHYTAQMLDVTDQQRITTSPVLASRTSWRTARLGKFWCQQHFPQRPLCLSHKNGASLLAIGGKEKPGVDLEWIRNRDVDGLMTHIGSQSEREMLTHSPYPILDFYRLWTLKESLIKAEDLDFPSDMKRVGMARAETGKLQLRSTRQRHYLWLNARLGDNWLFAALWPDIAHLPVTLSLHQPYDSSLTIHDLQTNASNLTLHSNVES
ncbi:4'-phosphopantetheinyl transferase superfamily protein [Cardiobacteriaceae bacterium TAE3-ERU3]|nr:4'-phosphopantetheinyl transferase superfamily protein [Cardiobacteriaceae bacterium TAE3-ERU3]